MVSSNVEWAIEKLKNGSFVLVYDADGREEETDFFIGAEFMQPVHVREMRKNGGGLIFLMVHHDICGKYKLPFLTDLYSEAEDRFPALGYLVANDIPYDTKSSFSLTINHRKTYTGVTDRDRALTMRDFALMAKNNQDLEGEKALQELGKRFRSPGHVPICRSSPRPLKDRFGHTELATALALMAGITPVVGGCEMMGGNDLALSKEKAIKYAEDNGLPFLEGKTIVEAFEEWSG